MTENDTKPVTANAEPRTVALCITSDGTGLIKIKVYDNHTMQDLMEDPSAVVIAKGLLALFNEAPTEVAHKGQESILEDVLDKVPDYRRERHRISIDNFDEDTPTEGEA